MKKLKKTGGKIWSFAKSRKITSSAIIAVLLFAGYYGYGKAFGSEESSRYVVAEAGKGTIIVSTSGTGQVSASNQADIKSKVSGDIISLPAMAGREVVSGQIIAVLDSTEASKAVRDAEISLESAKLSLQKIKKPADALSLAEAENTLARAEESKRKAEDDLAKAYDDGFNSVSNAFLDLPGVIGGLHDILYSGSAGLGGTSRWNIDYYAEAAGVYDEKAEDFKVDADAKYQKARKAYDANFISYKGIDREAGDEKIENLILQTYETAKSVSDAVKSANNLIQFYQDKYLEHNLDPASLSQTHLSSLNSYTGKVNNHLGSLLSSGTSIKNDKDGIINASRTISENKGSLENLRAGSDELDIRSAELSVAQRENALLDAKNNLAHYYIRAPFAGTLAKVSVKKGESAGNGTVIATIITKEKTAEISLNEIDAAKVKIGNKAKITFDAVPDLSISGEVIELDTVGTVSQGVVSYSAKIGFGVQDERIKPGMSLSASIITEAKEGVLVVPASAVKSQGRTSYAEVFNPKLPVSAGVSGQGGIASDVLPKRVIVETGLSNDTQIEITGGLSPGDQVVVRTINGESAPAANAAPSLFGGGARTGGVRINR